jgi:hypothetical protein
VPSCNYEDTQDAWKSVLQFILLRLLNLLSNLISAYPRAFGLKFFLSKRYESENIPLSSFIEGNRCVRFLENSSLGNVLLGSAFIVSFSYSLGIVQGGSSKFSSGERAIIAEWQGASKDENFEAKPTPHKTNFSNTSGITQQEML